MECPPSDLKGTESLDISNDPGKRPSRPHEGPIQNQGRPMSTREESAVCKLKMESHPPW